MSKELIVDGKKYLPSTVLAGRFSYTTDYLGKLAREEKVDATRVGRQWMISEESLQEFVAKTNESKAKRNQTLREERMRERKQKEGGYQVSKSVPSFAPASVVTAKEPVNAVLPSQLEAVLQTMAVSLCACIVGVLGFVMIDNGIGLQKLTTGTSEVVDDVVTVVNPTDITIDSDSQIAAVDFAAWWNWLFGEVEVEEEIETESERVAQSDVVTEVETQRPVVKNAMLMLDPTTSTTTVKEIRESFSDQVDVEFDGPDTGILKPVFKEQTDEAYRFLLVPVVEESNSL